MSYNSMINVCEISGDREVIILVMGPREALQRK